MARMSSTPEGSAGAATLAAANDNDGFAEAYSTETENNLLNRYCARPRPGCRLPPTTRGPLRDLLPLRASGSVAQQHAVLYGRTAKETADSVQVFARIVSEPALQGVCIHARVLPQRPWPAMVCVLAL